MINAVHGHCGSTLPGLYDFIRQGEHCVDDCTRVLLYNTYTGRERGVVAILWASFVNMPFSRQRIIAGAIKVFTEKQFQKL